MNQKQKYPKVGIGVFVIKDGKFLLGKRKNVHGDRTWCLVGGHLEYGESWENCARREIKEEVGIKVKNIRFSGAVTNDFFEKEQKHYVTIFMLCDYVSGKVKVLEPEKSECWKWFSWDNLPEPLFLPLVNLRKQKYNPFEK